MNLETTRFGNVEIDDDRVINFSSGLLGFSSYSKFVLLQLARHRGAFPDLLWLKTRKYTACRSGHTNIALH